MAATAGFTSMSPAPGAQEERGARVAIEVVAGAHQIVHRAHQALGHLVQVLLVSRDVLVDHVRFPASSPLLGWKSTCPGPRPANRAGRRLTSDSVWEVEPDTIASLPGVNVGRPVGVVGDVHAQLARELGHELVTLVRQLVDAARGGGALGICWLSDAIWAASWLTWPSVLVMLWTVCWLSVLRAVEVWLSDEVRLLASCTSVARAALSEGLLASVDQSCQNWVSWLEIPVRGGLGEVPLHRLEAGLLGSQHPLVALLGIALRAAGRGC